MENRKCKSDNGKPANVRCLEFAVSGFLCSIFLSFAAYGAPPTAPPTPHVPDGLGQAKFGMTLAQVRQLYPALAPAPAMTGAAYVKSPHLTRYVVPKVDVPGLQGQCTLELRFWKDQLWSVIVYYGTTPFSTVVENLRREYGPPTTTIGDPTWKLRHAAIVTSRSQMWYSLEDSEMSMDVERAFLEAIHERQTGKALHTAAGPPAGQGTPVAPTP
jgi:hypothetical protein